MLAELIVWDIGILFHCVRDNCEYVSIAPDSWERARTMVEAYYERTYGPSLVGPGQ